MIVGQIFNLPGPIERDVLFQISLACHCVARGALPTRLNDGMGQHKGAQQAVQKTDPCGASPKG